MNDFEAFLNDLEPLCEKGVVTPVECKYLATLRAKIGGGEALTGAESLRLRLIHRDYLTD